MTAIATDLDESVGRRSVLGRAFDILDCFALEGEQTIASLCAQTGLPPATVHRMLASLVEWGAVERASRGRYLLGRRLWRLGAGVPLVRKLREVARPALVDVHTATRCPVLLATRDDDAILITDVIAGRESHHLFRHQARITSRRHAPWIVTTAFSPLEADREPAIDLAYRQQVGAAKRQGFAVTTADGFTWVCAPVLDENGELRSTLTIVLPQAAYKEAMHARIVVRAAHEISAGLGNRRSRSILQDMAAVPALAAV